MAEDMNNNNNNENGAENNGSMSIVGVETKRK